MAGIASSRGKVSFWNFLPPDELNAILTLYARVTQKTLLISKTLGIEGKKLLRPEDDYEALKEFNQAYEGTKSAVEDMHLESVGKHGRKHGNRSGRRPDLCLYGRGGTVRMLCFRAIVFGEGRNVNFDPCAERHLKLSKILRRQVFI